MLSRAGEFTQVQQALAGSGWPRKQFGVLLALGKAKQLFGEGIARDEISAYEMKNP